jgi:hypothetical protein
VKIGEEIDNRESEERQCYKSQAQRKFPASDPEIQRYLPLRFFRLPVAQNQNRKSLHRETPDNAEGIGIAQQLNVSPGQDDGDDLQDYDHRDDVCGGSEYFVWIPRTNHGADFPRYPSAMPPA